MLVHLLAMLGDSMDGISIYNIICIILVDLSLSFGKTAVEPLPSAQVHAIKKSKLGDAWAVHGNPSMPIV